MGFIHWSKIKKTQLILLNENDDSIVESYGKEVGQNVQCSFPQISV